MEKCNCVFCQAKEFFTGFDKNGKYTEEVTETPSIYEEVLKLLHHLRNAGNVDPSLLSDLEDIATRIDKLDTNLLELHTEVANPAEYVREQIDKLREELY